MRSSIWAQSCASVPPAPAWMSTNALCESISPGNMRWNSSLRTSLSSVRASRSMSRAVRSSFSASASSSSSRGVRRALGDAVDLADSAPSRRARSLPEFLRASGLVQTAGSRARGYFFEALASCGRSQRNPRKEVDALLEIFELALELIDFHNGPAARSGNAGERCYHGPRALSGAGEVLDEQLQAPLALVLVHVEAIHQLAPARRRRDCGAACSTWLKAIASKRRPLFAAATQFQVPLAHDARAARRRTRRRSSGSGNAWPQGPAARSALRASRARSPRLRAHRRSRSHAAGIAGVEPARHLLIERAREAIELRALRASSPPPSRDRRNLLISSG